MLNAADWRRFLSTKQSTERVSFVNDVCVQTTTEAAAAPCNVFVGTRLPNTLEHVTTRMLLFVK